MTTVQTGNGGGGDGGGESSSFRRILFSVATRRHLRRRQGRGVSSSSKTTTTHPIFLLALLLLAVLMSVSNIRGATNLLPLHDHNNGSPLDNVIPRQQQQQQQQPVSSTSMMKKRETSNDRSRWTLANGPTSNVTTTTSKDGNGLVPITEITTSSSSSSSNIFVLPNDNNTVITMISMGRLVDTYVVERCIRSIRLRGQFRGPIFLFTDEVGSTIYNHSMGWDKDNTFIVQGWDEDLHPTTTMAAGVVTSLTDTNGNNIDHQTQNDHHQRPQQQPKKYAQQKMIYKRFKTHHFKYIDALLSNDNKEGGDSSTDNIRYVLYVDVDNMIGAPLAQFFHDYNKAILDQYEVWQRQYHPESPMNAKQQSQPQQPDFSFMSMFRDTHLKGKMHSGVILYDRYFERRCTDGWRYEMDTYWHSSDQTMLLRVLGNFTQYRCLAMALPSKHLAFASKRLIRHRPEGKETLPTFMHITNYRTQKMTGEVHVQEDFVRHVLYLTNKDETMVDGIKWEQVVPPNGGNRSNPL